MGGRTSNRPFRCFCKKRLSRRLFANDFFKAGYLTMDYTFSNRIASLKPSAIREILKATSDPSVVPFSAGNPAPEAFPIDDVRAITEKLLREEPILSLQYGVTEGYTPLRETITDYMRRKHNIGRQFDDIIITSGAQQVMDLAAKALCNEGDTILCEDPSFIGSLNAFRAYGVKLRGVPVTQDGMDMDALEQALQTCKNVRFIYTIPNFQNPSGVTMSLKKRERLYALAKQYGVLIVEDNPYGDLRVAGEHIPSIKSLDEEGLVIYAGSFSKILSPGIRVGFAIAPSELLAKMTVGKQTSDVHTTMLCQLIVYEWMNHYDFEAHIAKIRNIYRGKLNLMCSLIDSELGDLVTYVRPEGGLFVWCKLPESVSMLEFCQKAVAQKVAVVPGNAFLADENAPTNCFRMNFSTPTDEAIVTGMQRLGQVAASYR